MGLVDGADTALSSLAIRHEGPTVARAHQHGYRAGDDEVW
jgi:hypothetical protein